MSIFDTVLHIPSEPRSFVAPRAFTRITLPLTARPGPRFLIAAIGTTGASATCLWLAYLLTGAAGGSSRYVFAAAFALLALVPGAIAATAVRDALFLQPVLAITADGLSDRRLGQETIAWDAVEAAAIVASTNGIAAVRLTLVRDGAPRFNPFRIGGWSAQWHRRRRDRVVALALLNRRPHDLAHSILALAERHEAAVKRTAWPP